MSSHPQFLGWRFMGLVALAFLLTRAAPAAIIFKATLTGSQEVGPNSSPAIGFLTATLNDAETELAFEITYTGLTGGPVSGAHFHAPALPGVNASIVRGVAGAVNDVGAFGSPNGSISGIWKNTDTQSLSALRVQQLKDGLVYFNIHTNDSVLPNFPGGEIRGQLGAVPEPSTFVMMLLGGIGLAAARRFRRHEPK